MSARSYAEFEFWFASIKVAAILVFVVIAASYAFGWSAPHGATFGNLALTAVLRRAAGLRCWRQSQRFLSP